MKLLRRVGQFVCDIYLLPITFGVAIVPSVCQSVGLSGMLNARREDTGEYTSLCSPSGGRERSSGTLEKFKYCARRINLRSA